MVNKLRFYNTIMFKQFFLTFILIAGIVMAVTGSFVNHMLDSLKQQSISEAEVILDKTNQNIDTLFENISNAYQFIFLKDYNTSEQIIANFDQIRRYAGVNSSMIKGIHLIHNPGQSIRAVSTIQQQLDIVSTQYLYNLYNYAQNSPGQIIPSQAFYSPLQTDYTISFLATVKDTTERYNYVLVVEINADYLKEQVLKFAQPDLQTLLVLDQLGQPITYDNTNEFFKQQPNTYPTMIEESFLAKIAYIRNQSAEIEHNGRDSLILSSTDNVPGWNVLMLTDKDMLFSRSTVFKNDILKGAMLYLPFIFIFCFVLGKYTTDPIKQLSTQMNKIRNDLEIQQKLRPRNDETGILTERFYVLMDRISQLVHNRVEIEKQKNEIQMKMLQSQINPHFLGNTLVCIKSLFHSGKTEHIDTAIQSLIRLLYASTDKLGPVFTFEEELECLKAYVNIQQLRFERKVELKINVLPSHLPYMIPKLILQPIVENSIIHGFANLKHTGIIEIESMETDDNFHIFVVDNGSGFDKKKLSFTMNADHETKKSYYTSIGINNVRERIRLYTGDHSDLYIHSEPGKGTVCELCLPRSSQADPNGR